MGVTRKNVEKCGIGARACTMAGAAPTDLLYGSRGIPAAYRPPGSLGPHEPCPSRPWVTIDDTITELSVEAGKKEDTRREYWAQSWGTSSPLVKDHVQTGVILEYPRRNQTMSPVGAAAQRLGAAANVARHNCPRGMQKGR